MVTILYTIPNFKTAGSQYVLLELYKRIDRSKFKPYVLVEKFPDIFPDEIPSEERLHITEAVGQRSYIGQLATLLKEKKIDLVHSWDYKSNSIEALASRKAGVKYLYTKKNNAWSKRWFAKSFLSSHVVYNNPEMQERFFSHFLLKHKTSFIPHGVDTEIFKPLESTKSTENFVIGCIGVLGENKNQLLLLKALLELPETVCVHFYGKGNEAYKVTLDSFIKKHNLENRVACKGYIANQDIPKAMATFDVLVLPSKNEGLPLSIMEAMACGVAVLSSNSGGGAQFLLKDEAGGYIFEDRASLISQLLQLYKNPTLRTQLGKKGRARIISSFSIEKEVDAYKQLYLSMLKREF
ncbi:glycosyltransferase family 4 protein [Marinirhabdus gelatinilytica]|uniref:Glycosyltransferase involved in cell wall biosynthesis n=1 Tax=Marinirhabdus gelatinilytica TaxID=1703343 RepID=A0A370Q920_9FLAO|nr:glycosyltransferase family 4 protein [Marinirhabdus gelatinilytica]RDK84819.1 glycosyltransferase involved in cell wall biosynthesis [Marinirhabdus gelatinilytica]